MDMANFPNPITKDNFPKAWRIVRRRYKLAKVKAAIRRIAKPVGEFLFFPAFLMLAFGAAISFTTPGIQALIGKTPFVAPLWFQLKAILFGSASSTLDYIIRGAAFLYAIPFGAFLAVSLVIAIVYHRSKNGNGIQLPINFSSHSITYPTFLTVRILAPSSISFWRNVFICISTVLVSPSK